MKSVWLGCCSLALGLWGCDIYLDRDYAKYLAGGLIGDPYDLQTVAFTPDGKQLLSASQYEDYSNPAAGRIHLWDVEARQLERVLLADGCFFGAAISPDGRLASAVSWSGRSGCDPLVALGSTSDWSLQAIEPVAWESPLGMAFSPDSQVMAVLDGSSAVVLLNTGTLQPLSQSPLNLDFLHLDLAFSADGKWLAIGGDGPTTTDSSTRHMVTLLQTSNWQIGGNLDAREGRALTLSFSPDGKWLATAGQTSLLYLWSVDELNVGPIGAVQPREVGMPEDQGIWAMVRDLAFSPDSKWLAATGHQGSNTHQDGRTCLYRVEDGALIRCVNEGTAGIAAVFSPDGATLASGGTDRNIKLWDAQKMIRDQGTP